MRGDSSAPIVNQATTTTGLLVSAPTSVFGQQVSMAATVTGVSPTGTVTFKDVFDGGQDSYLAGISDALVFV